MHAECINTGKRDEGKPARSDQVEDLQTQTTNLGLQLNKQIEGNSDLIGTVYSVYVCSYVCTTSPLFFKYVGKSAHKMEEMKTEIRAMVKDTR